MSFHVGQQVVCVDLTDPPLKLGCPPWEPVATWLAKGLIYTIRGGAMWEHPYVGIYELHLWLEEVQRDCDGPFRALRFRPLKTTDISIFEAMLNRAPERIDA